MMNVESLFHLKENQTNVRTEVIAGCTTFMTMAYVIFVHPAILTDAGMPFDAVLFATCVSAAVATLIMALAANYPFALAPGMGLNAYFAYTAVPFIARTLGVGDAWKVALGAVFISGCIFMVLTFSRIRAMIINAVPEAIKVGIAVGIGLFIAMLGLEKAGIVVESPDTLVTMGNLKAPNTLLAIFGLIVTSVLMARRIKGAILIGIIITTLAGIAFRLVEMPGDLVSIPEFKSTFLALDMRGALKVGLLNMVFVFLFIDLFDTMGTLVGIGERGGFMVGGKLPRANRALLADAGGTLVGSLLGTSTVTTYIESAAGISEGGKTGLTGLVVAALFLACIVISPIAAIVPDAATAPALIIVGSLMMAVVGKIKWEAPDEAIPAFLTLIAVPLTSSIANGLAIGFISYPIVKALSGRWREVNILVYVLAALFVLRFAMLSF
jgi:AGZA family xanthine/uracil permease-like MFS transporter